MGVTRLDRVTAEGRGRRQVPSSFVWCRRSGVPLYDLGWSLWTKARTWHPRIADGMFNWGGGGAKRRQMTARSSPRPRRTPLTITNARPRRGRVVTADGGVGGREEEASFHRRPPRPPPRSRRPPPPLLFLFFFSGGGSPTSAWRAPSRRRPPWQSAARVVPTGPPPLLAGILTTTTNERYADAVGRKKNRANGPTGGRSS